MKAFIDELARHARNELAGRPHPMYLLALGQAGITNREACDRLRGLADGAELSEEDRAYAQEKLAQLGVRL